jgi:hypothetical protein
MSIRPWTKNPHTIRNVFGRFPKNLVNAHHVLPLGTAPPN